MCSSNRRGINHPSDQGIQPLSNQHDKAKEVFNRNIDIQSCHKVFQVDEKHEVLESEEPTLQLDESKHFPDQQIEVEEEKQQKEEASCSLGAHAPCSFQAEEEGKDYWIWNGVSF